MAEGPGTGTGAGTLPGPRDAPAAFHRRLHDALADSRLRQALAVTTGRLAGGRARAFESLANPEETRDAARHIRARTIAGLDRYLEMFADQAAARGCTVHWAETAQDASRVVVEIARAEGVSLAVKAKSMLSEEIGLNHALEAASVTVVETDLGEFVVQVAADRPSHIIAPIVHWRREDVARLFQEKLGATDDDVRDVPAITAFARRTLRERFLRAGMGISGVNFAVADTGSLCLVTNEGNGRLTTSAPRVHVALLGLERLVPTAADLGVMLKVLARSATGQALSVYSNIITGPRRRDGEHDGPDRLHVVIVDNGRSRLLASSLAEILYCIRCGACLNVCPVYRLVGGHAYDSVYPGPMGSVVTPGLFGLEGAAELAHASSLCGACRDVCPVRIDLPHLLVDVRRQGVGQSLAPWWLRAGIALYTKLSTRPAAFRLAGSIAARLAGLLATDGRLRRLPGPLAGWTAHRDFPVPAATSFVERWHATRAGKGGGS